MSYDLTKLLVIGISSQALFDLDFEDKIYRSHGLQPFIDYQRAHESEMLQPGPAFPLIQGLLRVNELTGDKKIEVVLMSRNHPDVCLRVFNSIEGHKLEISRAALTGGASVGPYLSAYNVGLFLSASKADVQEAANKGFAAGLIYPSPSNLTSDIFPIKIAFDGDRVLFSDEAQRIYDEHGPNAFFEHERRKAQSALPDGPFANLLRTLRKL